MDDSRPKPWIIGVGAFAIAAVALSIGWMSNRHADGASQTVRREPVRIANAALALGTPAIAQPAFSARPGVLASAASSVTQPFVATDTKANYLYNPPPPKRRRPVEEPLPPPVPLAQIAAARPRYYTVRVAQNFTPAIPAYPGYGYSGSRAPYNYYRPSTPLYNAVLPQSFAQPIPEVAPAPAVQPRAAPESLNPFTSPTNGFGAPSSQPAPGGPGADSRTE